MSRELVEYPEIILPRLRYQFCPMCRTALSTGVINDDNIERVLCPSCGWVHYPTNVMGVNVVIRVGENGVVALLPPNEPEDTPAALPAGHVEYGESPVEAAVREAKEETGLDVEVVRSLGWEFKCNKGYPGPMASFFFEAKAVGGHLVESEEGRLRIYPIPDFPAISPNRGGSFNAWTLFKESLHP
jgi:ADP-ribose pyrophosphatase YjhB (NUDIX family)